MKKIIFITLMLFASFAVFSVPNEKTSPPSASETIFNVSQTATTVVTVLQPFQLPLFETSNFIGTNSNETTIVIYKLFETLIFECYIEIENSHNFTYNKFIYKDNRQLYLSKKTINTDINTIINKPDSQLIQKTIDKYKDKRLIYLSNNKPINNKHNRQFTPKNTIHYFSWYSKSSLC